MKIHPLSTQHDMARRQVRSLVIARAYADKTQTVLGIAEKYGVSLGTVCNIGRRFGIRRRYCGFTTKIRDLVIKMYKAEAPIKEIREAAGGIDRKTIWTIVKKAQLPLRRASPFSKRKVKHPKQRYRK